MKKIFQNVVKGAEGTTLKKNQQFQQFHMNLEVRLYLILFSSLQLSYCLKVNCLIYSILNL